MKRSMRRRKPALRLTPYAWAKLLCLRDAGPTEIAAFGVAPTDDPLLIEDVETVRQVCSAASVLLDDAAVADFFDRQVERGLEPSQFARVWLHTHPGDSPMPSGTDEETFGRVFGGCDWAVMAILARGGGTYARLRVSGGPGAEVRLPVRVDWDAPFRASDHEGWLAEHAARVEEEPEWDPFHEGLLALDEFSAGSLWAAAPD